MSRPYELDPSKTSIADEVGNLARNDLDGALKVWRKALTLNKQGKLAEAVDEVAHKLAMLQDDPESFDNAINE